MEPPTSKFLDLPLELYLQIFLDIEPLDLLSLGQTCKTFHELLSQREIWETALRLVIYKNELFEPSYEPIESMDVSELRRATLGPTLWHNMLSNVADTANHVLHPVSVKVLEREKIPDYLNRDIERVWLVPGGRYLFGMSQADVTLWDLGMPDPTHRMKVHPVALGTEHLGSAMSLAVARFESKFLRFAVLARRKAAIASFHVYEVGPLPGATAIRVLGEFSFQAMGFRHVGLYWITGDHLFFVVNHVLVCAWDFTRNLSKVWTCGEPIFQLITVGDFVVAFTASSLIGWKMPSLDPMHNNLIFEPRPEEVTLPPDFRIELGADIESLLTVGRNLVNLPSKWYFRASPLVFDILGPATDDTDGRHRVQVRRYKLDFALGDPPTSSITFLSQFSFAQSDARRYSNGLKAPVLSSGHHLMVSPAYLALNESPYLVYSSMEASNPGKCHKIFLDPHPDHHEFVSMSVCPSSCRMAYYCDNNHEDGFNRVHVVDIVRGGLLSGEGCWYSILA